MTRFTRRDFLHRSGAWLALAALPAASWPLRAEELRIAHSSGSQPPVLQAPTGACDAHIHVVDGRFAPANPATPPVSGMEVASYRQLQRRLGTQRVVIVQPKYFGTDNRCTLDAVGQFAGNARGIAVVHPSATDAQLLALHEGGIRGLRFSLWNPTDRVTTVDMIEPLAARIADLGWHVQLHLSAAQILEHQALLARLPVPVVFDHMGRLPPETGAAHPAFAVIARLLEADRAWVKLAGAYLNTRLGAPAYADASRVARAFVEIAAPRLVWGSDWPHVTETTKPDDAGLLDLLLDWAGDEALRQRILVDNPARLYGFGAA